MARSYKELEIYRLAYGFVTQLYPYIDKFPESEHRNLVIQMKRCAVSIPLNIAEGSSRRTDRQFLVFLDYAFGSAKEMEVTLELSKDLGFLKEDDYKIIYEDLQKFIAKLVLFSRYLEKGVPRTKDVLTNKILRAGVSALDVLVPSTATT